MPRRAEQGRVRPGELQAQVGEMQPGTTIHLKVLRDGSSIDVPVTLEAMTKGEHGGESEGEGEGKARRQGKRWCTSKALRICAWSR